MKYVIKMISLLVITLFFLNTRLFAQTIISTTESVVPNNDDRIRLAMTSSDYQVTAGDIYNLSFLAGNNSVSYSITVDPTYKIRIANLAVLNVVNTSFLSLKKQVEEIVTKNFPMSGVQFNLITPGSFKVVIKGEVNEAIEVDAWALTRLSTVVDKYKNNFASIRNVTIKNSRGIHTYDLFKAKRYADFSQDPYLRPGDEITLYPLEKKITISGAIERPGTYELVEGENLVDLVTLYGHGLLPMADTSRIEVTTVFDSDNKAGKKVYLSSVNPKYNLQNYDSVFIPSYTDLKPFVFVEGAILISEETTKPDDSEEVKEDNIESQRKSVPFAPGLNYASFIREHRDWFTSTKSDIDNAYIIRGDERIAINLRTILYDNSYYSPLLVEENDTLLVPFKQSFVITVRGEVQKNTEIPTTPYTRVSSIFDDITTPFSSRRDITVISIDGTKHKCDLYKAERTGDLSFNPYLKPGDKVIVGRIDRKITIEGAVERPGRYEILPGENLKTLVEEYGNGLLPNADTSRIEITKLLDSESKTGEKLYFDNIDESFVLTNLDTVFIPSFNDLQPIVFVEGAIYTEGSTMEESVRVPIRFNPGLNYASFIRDNESWFTSTKSDIDNAYVVRGENRINVNVRKILYDRSYYSDISVEPNDILTIPFKQSFIAYVDGEVTICGEVPINAFTRLSTIVNEVSTLYSSQRDITIKSQDGEIKKCDLFKATRDGDLSQNPYLKPSDVITVGRLKRQVTIAGAVERPGTYELLEDETLTDLIERYGHGLAPLADTSRIKITRILDDKKRSGEVFYLRKINDVFDLLCYDTVEIASFKDLKPIVFIEGAIDGNSTETELEGSKKMSFRFDSGLNYSTFIREHESLISAKSDLSHAYIIRGEERISINLEQILYDESFYSEIKLEPYDTLIIPFKQRYISVAGAVAIPGRYPYIPDRTYEYYIGIAGGFIDEKNTGKAVEIMDINGDKISKNDIIPPEATITAKSNSFTYYFNMYAPIISTLLGIISTSISIGFMATSRN